MAKSSSAKVTSSKVASKASKALQDGRSSTRTRSIAGSAPRADTGQARQVAARSREPTLLAHTRRLWP